MRKMAVGVVFAGIALAAASSPAAAQAGDAPQTTVTAQAQPAPLPPAPEMTPQTTPAPTTADGTQGSAVARFGPTAAGAQLLAPVRADADQRPLVHTPAYRRNAPGVALMIVGGALFLGGAIVSGQAGDALMVGGVVVAAVGLYQYLQ